MSEAEGVSGMGEGQEQYAGAVHVFFSGAYERRKAVASAADVLLDVTTGSTAVGSSTEPDTQAKWPPVTPPPTTRKLSSPHLAQVMETDLKEP